LNTHLNEKNSGQVIDKINSLTPAYGAFIVEGLGHVVPGVFIVPVLVPIFC
jgi:hypothetical protein